MFNFRIINTPDGNQIIDRTLCTPYEALTPLQMIEYTEVDNQLTYIERMDRKAKVKAEYAKKLTRNPFYKMACAIGLI